MTTLSRQIYNHIGQNRRSLFHWINLQFNSLDENRRALLGPDRTCAEWILRNGGSVKFAEIKEATDDYNSLPKEEVPVRLQEVHAIDCSIMGVGFKHFDGCKHVRKVIFRQCNYLENDALKELRYLEGSLEDLEVTNCLNISDEGLLYINALKKLRSISFNGLPGVKDKDRVLQTLKTDIPQASIVFN